MKESKTGTVLELRSRLDDLAVVLKSNGEDYWHGEIRAVLSSDDEKVIDFVTSNTMWGGAGSIADQAGLDEAMSIRRDVEIALIELGEAQIDAGIVNERTEFWVRGAKKILKDLS